MKPLVSSVLLVAIAFGAQPAVACTASAPANSHASARTPATSASPSTTTATTATVPGPSSTEVAEPPKVPSGMTVGYAVFDRDTGRTTIAYRVHRRFRSASVVKILIALDYLERTAAVSSADRALLRSMLRSSDNRPATVLWTRGGQAKIIHRMAAKLALSDTAPPPADKPGYWGYTAISAADIVRTYRYLLEKAPRLTRRLIMGHLAGATPCGSDGFDQYFGIPRAVPRPWAVKQGWSGYGDTPPRRCDPRRVTDETRLQSRELGQPVGLTLAPDLGLGRPVLHTTGTVGAGHRRIVVVLSLHPAGSSWQTSTTRLTAFTKAVYRAAGHG